MAFPTSPSPTTPPLIQYGKGLSSFTATTTVQTCSSSWQDFTSLFTKDRLILLADKMNSPWVLPWTFKEGKPKERAKENLDSLTILSLDLDNKTDSPTTFNQAHQALQRATQDPQSPLYNHAAILYTTYNHTPDRPRLRIFLPLDPEHLIHKDQKEKIKDLGWSVMTLLGLPLPSVDNSTFDAARVFFLPACPSEAVSLYQYAIFPTDPQPVTFLNPDTISTSPKSNVVPISNKIDLNLPVHKSGPTMSPTLPAYIDPTQYKKLMATSRKLLREGPPDWSLHKLEEMLDAAPYMGLEDRGNYAMLLKCFTTYEEEIDNLSSDIEGPLPGRAFATFVSMAQQGKGYESMPDAEHRTRWEDMKNGGNEYGFKGIEASHPNIFFDKAYSNGFGKVKMEAVASANMDDLEWDYSKNWPFPIRHRFDGTINVKTIGEWAVKECKGLLYLGVKGGETSGEWRYDPEYGVFLYSEVVSFSSDLCDRLYDVLITKEKEANIKILISSPFNNSVKRKVFEAKDIFNKSPTRLFIKSFTDFDLAEFGYILPVKNGFLDLREGKLLSLSHSEKMRMKFTKVMPVPYYEDAPEPIEFLKFLNTVCKGRKDMIEDLRDFLAGSLWGTSSNTAGVLVGNGNNGKSVLVNTLMKMFGFEAGAPDVEKSFATIQDSVFIAKKSRSIENSSAPKPELSGLHGRRLLRIQETGDDMVLDGEKIKTLHAEGAALRARGLFEGSYKIQNNTTTMIIETNHAPIVIGGMAMDRRIVFFPFEHVFPLNDGDKNKFDFPKMYFEKEGPAILKWLVHARRPNKNSGWGETVSNYTGHILGDSNPFRLFVNDCIEKTESASDILTTAELISMYRDWALKNKIISMEKIGLLNSKLMGRVSPFMPRRPIRVQGSSGPVSVFEYVKPAKGIVIEGACTEVQTVKLKLSLPAFLRSFLDGHVQITHNPSDHFAVSDALSILQRSADAELRKELNTTSFGLWLGEWVRENKLTKKESMMHGVKKARVFGAVWVEGENG